MPHWSRLLAFSVVVLLGAGPALGADAPPDRARIAAARELIGAMRAVEGVREALPMLAGSIRSIIVKANPATEDDIDEALAALHGRMAAQVDDLVDEIAPVYARGFTREELESMTAFYRSPAGARLAAMQPQMLQATVAIGQRWGERIAAEIEADLKSRLRSKGHAI